MTKQDDAGPADFRLLDTQLLALFELLYQTGSVTRAAERLRLSQPTVSIWLAKLRRALGDPLFVRTPSGMQPTARAEALIGLVRESLAALRRLASRPEGFEAARSQRQFRICMTDASHVTLLPALLAHLRALAPGIRLEAAGINGATGPALASGEADLALGLVPNLAAGCYQQTLFTQDWVCLANAHHPRLQGGLALKAYRAEAHVGIVQGTGYRLLEAALRAQGVERRVLLQLPGFLGLPAILSTTDLVATLPRQIGTTLARGAGLQVLPCPVAIPGFAVKQVWHARNHHDAANRWLRARCAELFLQRPVPARRRASAG